MATTHTYEVLSYSTNCDVSKGFYAKLAEIWDTCILIPDYHKEIEEGNNKILREVWQHFERWCNDRA